MSRASLAALLLLFASEAFAQSPVEALRQALGLEQKSQPVSQPEPARVSRRADSGRTYRCSSRKGRHGYWAWRIVDGRRCWYRGLRGVSKTRLSWGGQREDNGRRPSTSGRIVRLGDNPVDTGVDDNGVWPPLAPRTSSSDIWTLLPPSYEEQDASIMRLLFAERLDDPLIPARVTMPLVFTGHMAPEPPRRKQDRLDAPPQVHAVVYRAPDVTPIVHQPTPHPDWQRGLISLAFSSVLIILAGLTGLAVVHSVRTSGEKRHARHRS